jgi:dethiobiotin synthetase
MDTKVVFITGTDTGVGKTLLTALLLCHLRSLGARAFALKPFCSGNRGDAELLFKLQAEDLSLDEVNPFYFPEPVAPLISSRKHGTGVSLNEVLRQIRSIARRAGQLPFTHPGSAQIKNPKLKTKNFLLLEGSGGLLVPLGEGYTVRDLIARLDCEVIVVSRNRLGTINHTLLTLQSLGRFRTPRSALKVVLMDAAPSRDVSRNSNAALLAEWIRPVPLVKLPFLGAGCSSVSRLQQAARRLRANLQLLA